MRATIPVTRQMPKNIPVPVLAWRGAWKQGRGWAMCGYWSAYSTQACAVSLWDMLWSWAVLVFGFPGRCPLETFKWVFLIESQSCLCWNRWSSPTVHPALPSPSLNLVDQGDSWITGSFAGIHAGKIDLFSKHLVLDRNKCQGRSKQGALETWKWKN